MITDYTATLEISTDCTCEYYDDNEELQPHAECYGCYDEDKDFVINELEEWLGRNNVEAVEVVANGMGWRNTSAIAWLPADSARIYALLTLNGDFRLVFKWDKEDKLSVTRYSHDEPVGTAPFEITPVPYDAYEQNA